MIAFWEAGYNPATLTRDVALELERTHPDSPGDSPNPMGNEVVNVGVPYDQIVWAGGSPTNTEKIMSHPLELDQGGGTSTMFSIYAYNQGEVNSIFKPSPSQWANDHERDNGVGYLYTERNAHGTPSPATMDRVLQVIGRSYGQEG